jgi:hypothetical protein
MDEGRGPARELEYRLRRLNEVRDPMDDGREPLKEFEARCR